MQSLGRNFSSQNGENHSVIQTHIRHCASLEAVDKPLVRPSSLPLPDWVDKTSLAQHKNKGPLTQMCHMIGFYLGQESQLPEIFNLVDVSETQNL